MHSRQHRQPPTDSVRNLIAGDQLGQLTGKLAEAPQYGILSLFATPSDVVWIAGWFGGIAYAHSEQIEELTIPLPRFTWFHDMLWHSGDDDYLFCQAAGQWHPALVPFTHCHALKTDPAGMLIAAPTEDLWVSSDGSHWQRLALFKSPTFITNFWIAGPGTLWLKTRNRKELYQYQWQQDRLTTVQLPRKGRASWDADILTVFPDRQGGVWASIDGIGLWYWDGEHWEAAPRARDYSQQGIIGCVKDLCVDHQGRLWAATDMGVCRQNQGVWQPLLVARERPDQTQATLFGQLGTQSTTRLAIDSTGRLWIGTSYGEILWIDTTSEPYTRPLDYPLELEAFSAITLHTL